ncbi:hypothetical protein DFR50_10481 [Roseiarcus fermentans]|uniref:Uncharacterized protein n=1 Tax=Roseiarcus fermentans TaxID=1473586 RepID=A0A366FQ21_9HYPH|nr:hypothetical protein [Roseiarcus fermentans]RBP16804.1 hypothetical protein DFR50_10481 [Roseiarcus fermentans]
MSDGEGAAPDARTANRNTATSEVTPEKSDASVVAAPAPAAYADGSPLDGLSYLEAKLILKPERFTSAKALREFGRIVRKTAEATKIAFTPDPEFDLPPKIREIVFADTPDFALYASAFILRRRIAYHEGFAVGDPEVVFKFRHPDLDRAQALDMRPKIEGKYRIKFKAELLPLKDRAGGYRVLYSHNCQFGLSQTKAKEKTSIATLAEIFPALTDIKTKADHVSIVNGGIVEEVLLPIGELDFGKGMTANCDVSLWRTRGEHRSLVGEFAFQAKFAAETGVAARQRERMERFYIALQHAVEDWLALGVTKTAMVYRLNGAAPQSHE